MTQSDGVYLLKFESWSYHSLPSSTICIYCDASPLGLGFWLPSSHKGFQAPAADLFQQHHESIFYLEALCVCTVLLYTIEVLPVGSQIAIFSDNINTVQMFNSLAALSSLNWMLVAIVDAVVEKSIDFWVLHVPGVHNIIADRLSHFHNDKVITLEPLLSIQAFQPPRGMMGAVSL